MFEQNKKKFQHLFNFQNIKRNSYRQTNLSYPFFSTCMDIESEDYKQFIEKFKKLEFANEKMENLKIQKAIAVFLGNYLGDALGAFTEFLELDVQREQLIHCFKDIDQHYRSHRSFCAEVGQHTDDCSMAKCIAESILTNPDSSSLNGRDCRLRFILWLDYGYCNGLLGRTSFGLGGNIASSLYKFKNSSEPEDFEESTGKNRHINGCGCVMRLAPCGICALNDIEKTLKFCVDSSLTTHNGLEAAECSKLLGFIIFTGCNSEKQGEDLKNELLGNLGKLFETHRNKDCLSIKFLAEAKQEDEDTFNQSDYPSEFNKSVKDRNWQWKDKVLYISEARSYNIGYYGSYCMDCMYVALHIVWNTNSYKEALVKAANLGGDCDSFGAVVGQICGAIYGISKEILDLYFEQPVKYDNYHTPYLAYKLAMQEHVKDGLVYFNKTQDENQNLSQQYSEQSNSQGEKSDEIEQDENNKIKEENSQKVIEEKNQNDQIDQNQLNQNNENQQSEDLINQENFKDEEHKNEEVLIKIQCE